MSEKVWTVYALTDPRYENAIRYIGITCQPLWTRAKTHIHPSPSIIRKEGHTRKARWVAELKACGMIPGVITIEQCGEDWAEREKHWISVTPNLTNLTDGGDGTPGRPQTQEAKDRIGAANRGRKHTEETRAKLRAAHARPGRVYPPRPYQMKPPKPPKVQTFLPGWKRSEETRANMRAGMRGVKKSEAGRANIKAARIAYVAAGHELSAETRWKLGVGSRGKKLGPYSAERRANISKALKGRKMPPGFGDAVRARMKANPQVGYMKGKRHSEETKTKMREGHARRKAALEAEKLKAAA